MLKITILQDPESNTLIAHADSVERSEVFFKKTKVVMSFDVSDLYLHGTQL